MSTLQKEFIEFSIQSNVLRFGEFRTKAGRLSPYFFNAGLFYTGTMLGKLADFYAKTLLQAEQEGKVQFDMIFGPAYKGIPLAAAVAMRLSELGRDVPFAYNRKEKKDHGEGGVVVGAPLSGRVVIIDDVISAGTSVRESVEIIKANGAVPAAVLIAIDRMERSGNAEKVGSVSAVKEVEELYAMPVVAIANLKDLLTYLQKTEDESLRHYVAAVEHYRELYGA
jgi:orotate phosphoribosyltransferase